MYDLIVVGSGPSGLYSSYLAKMHNLKVKIIEASSEIGGQMLLFKDKPVYDMPGQSNVKGKDVLNSFLKQLNDSQIKVSTNERLLKFTGTFMNFKVYTNKNVYKSKCIIFSTGGGMFEPIKLTIKNEDKFQNIHYFVSDANFYKNKKIVVFGGGDSAVDWAHFFMNQGNNVTLVHRRNQFRGQESLVEDLKRKINILTPYKIKNAYGEKFVNEIELINIKTRELKRIKCEEVLVFFGQKKTILKDDFELLEKKERKVIVRPNMETNIEGIYAIGNVATYFGKVDTIAAAIGESATAVGSVVNKIFPGKKMSYVTNI